MRAVYAGSFDPITSGHLDIIERACSVVDSLIVAVAIANTKNSLFDADVRAELIRQTLCGCDCADKVEVIIFDGLLVEFAQQHGANVLIRGLRAVADFEYEIQMAMMNRTLAREVETMFLMSSASQQFVSSRFVKEIHRLGGDVSNFVSAPVLQKLSERKKKQHV